MSRNQDGVQAPGIRADTPSSRRLRAIFEKMKADASERHSEGAEPSEGWVKLFGAPILDAHQQLECVEAIRDSLEVTVGAVAVSKYEAERKSKAALESKKHGANGGRKKNAANYKHISRAAGMYKYMLANGELSGAKKVSVEDCALILQKMRDCALVDWEKEPEDPLKLIHKRLVTYDDGDTGKWFKEPEYWRAWGAACTKFGQPKDE